MIIKNLNTGLLNSFLAIIIATGIISCEWKSDNPYEQRLRKINLVTKLQFAKNDGALLDMNGLLSIYYSQDLVMLKVASFKDSSIIHMSKDGKVLGETLVKLDTVFSYFVYKKNMSSGLKYQSITGKDMAIFSVDSLMKKKAFKGFEFFNPKSDHLFKKQTLSKDIYQEIYTPNVIHDSTYPDSSYYYFNKKLPDIGFSFSKYLDSAKNGFKLFKIKYIYNPVFDKDLKIRIPKREFHFELRSDTVLNQKQILGLFNKFRSTDLK